MSISILLGSMLNIHMSWKWWKWEIMCLEQELNPYLWYSRPVCSLTPPLYSHLPIYAAPCFRGQCKLLTTYIYLYLCVYIYICIQWSCLASVHYIPLYNKASLNWQTIRPTLNGPLREVIGLGSQNIITIVLYGWSFGTQIECSIYIYIYTLIIYVVTTLYSLHKIFTRTRQSMGECQPYKKKWRNQLEFGRGSRIPGSTIK